MAIYSDGFYLNQVSGAYYSGKIYADILKDIYVPAAVIDVGCGRGAWLKAFKDSANESNVQQVSTGLDGSWNSKEDLILQDVDYHSIDLNNLNQYDQPSRADLAISVETAEHIASSSTDKFISKLCQLSDVVIFSGAFKGQGGLYHINERRHSDWAELFHNNGYDVYDFFRSRVWGLKEVNYWYQQNVFLYVRKGSAVESILLNLNIHPISNIEFMNCVHPQAFDDRSSFFGQFKHMAQKKLPASLVIAASNLKKRIL